MTYKPRNGYNQSKICVFNGSHSNSDTAAVLSIANPGSGAVNLSPTNDESFSVSYYFRLHGATGDANTIVSKGNHTGSGSTNEWAVGHQYLAPYFWINGDLTANYIKYNHGSTYSYPRWLHLVFVYDHTVENEADRAQASQCSIYMEGGSVEYRSEGLTTASGDFANTDPFNIGGGLSATSSIPGYTESSISEVTFWNAALTRAQASELYNGGRPFNLKHHSAAANLKGWWLGGNGTVTFDSNYTVQDSSGSDFHLTSSGMSDGAITTGSPSA